CGKSSIRRVLLRALQSTRAIARADLGIHQFWWQRLHVRASCLDGRRSVRTSPVSFKTLCAGMVTDSVAQAKKLILAREGCAANFKPSTYALRTPLSTVRG